MIVCIGQLYLFMYNPFHHSSLSSYSNYHEWYPQSGFTNTRTLNQLELSIPINLLNDYPLSSTNISTQHRYHATQKYTSFPARQTRPASTVSPKENPFLTAKPFRVSDRNDAAYSRSGLTGWEKRRYLQRFSSENSDIDEPSSRYAFGGRQQQKKREDTGKGERTNAAGSSHLKKLFTFQTDNQREQPLSHHQAQYSFSHDDPSLQLAYNPTYTRQSNDQHHNQGLGQDAAARKIIRKASDRNKKYEDDQESLINRLDSNLEHKSLHLRTTNSKIVDFPGEQSQYEGYFQPNLKTSASERPELLSRLPILQQQHQGSKISQDSNPFQSALKNSHYPPTLHYRSLKYELIPLT